MKKILTALTLTATLVLTGCLDKETTHTLYLDAKSGEVTWTVLERDIRSDAESAAAREEEELDYLDLFAKTRHPVAAGLDVLRPFELEARMLRGERPYTAMTIRPCLSSYIRRRPSISISTGSGMADS